MNIVTLTNGATIEYRTEITNDLVNPFALFMQTVIDDRVHNEVIQYCDPLDLAVITYECATWYKSVVASIAAPKDTTHRHVYTMISRIINHPSAAPINDAHVVISRTLQEIARDYVVSYAGSNDFLLQLQTRFTRYGTLTVAQMRAALNILVTVWRADLIDEGIDANPAPATPPVVLDDVRPFIDLRGTHQRTLDEAIEGTDIALPANAQYMPCTIPTGYYTVILNDGSYRTIRVVLADEKYRASGYTHVVSYLNGPDNTSDYIGFAFLTNRKPRLWKKFADNAALREVLYKLVSVDTLRYAREYVKQSGKCFVCNRLLTTPESIALGIGPICLQNIQSLGYSHVELLPVNRMTADDRTAAKAAMAELFD